MRSPKVAVIRVPAELHEVPFLSDDSATTPAPLHHDCWRRPLSFEPLVRPCDQKYSQDQSLMITLRRNSLLQRMKGSSLNQRCLEVNMGCKSAELSRWHYLPVKTTPAEVGHGRRAVVDWKDSGGQRQSESTFPILKLVPWRIVHKVIIPAVM